MAPYGDDGGGAWGFPRDAAYPEGFEGPRQNFEKEEGVAIHEGNQLVVSGERKAPEIKNAVWHRQERPYGQFVRTVTLPVLVDADRVEARFEQGVLKLTLPKSAAAKPRKIQVRAG